MWDNRASSAQCKARCAVDGARKVNAKAQRGFAERRLHIAICNARLMGREWRMQEGFGVLMGEDRALEDAVRGARRGRGLPTEIGTVRTRFQKKGRGKGKARLGRRY